MLFSGNLKKHKLKELVSVFKGFKFRTMNNLKTHLDNAWEKKRKNVAGYYMSLYIKIKIFS